MLLKDLDGAETREHSTELGARNLTLARHECPVITSKGLLRFIENVLAAPCAVEFDVFVQPNHVSRAVPVGMLPAVHLLSETE